MNRRNFLKNTSLASMGVLAGSSLYGSHRSMHDLTRITILHTNDMHSRIEPFPDDGGRNANKGGMARRAKLVERVRAAEEHVLLLDSGDIFQGTPYFNFFGGELEFKLMSKMKYDAATLGNHDFDSGLEGLHKQMPHARFPFLTANYDFSDTILHGKTQEYKIINKGSTKIGIFGIGIELDGLVPETLYGNTRYLDPIERANKTASLLKNEMQCDLIICLSHLGYKYKSTKISDVVLAKATRHIDIILGGHTHTFMHEPDIQRNLDGEEVVINQAGWAGIMLGRLDVWIEKNKKGKCMSCKNTYVA